MNRMQKEAGNRGRKENVRKGRKNGRERELPLIIFRDAIIMFVLRRSGMRGRTNGSRSEDEGQDRKMER